MVVPPCTAEETPYRVIVMQFWSKRLKHSIAGKLCLPSWIGAYVSEVTCMRVNERLCITGDDSKGHVGPRQRVWR